MKTLSPSEKLAELVKEVRALDRKREAGILTVTERGKMDLLEERIMHAEADVTSERIRARMDSVAHLHPDMNKLNKPEIPALKTAGSPKNASTLLPQAVMFGQVTEKLWVMFQEKYPFATKQDFQKNLPGMLKNH